ncbi:ABC transporter permease [Kineosporia rhizophila]|uniref:ABC transporter permease n=1 Tax=Kineosporia TaxID=49184 RepID=UPI001E352903|nr:MULTISPECIES: ABC transporter permease [Kineosporia]MCE0536459.1 ABC transporter permease [Kineosporia rhizophila]GLY15447.1 ABC transporter permease [Kineosporia sp. NBRC 101677]
MSTAAPETAQRTYPAYSQPLWRRLLASREAAVVAMVLIVYFYGYSNIPYFGDTLTLTYILIDMTTILLIALPMTLVIITGEIDLSIASVVGLSSAVLGLLVQDGAPMGLAVLVALLVGVVCGVFNGFLVAYVGLPSLAVTIGTLALYRGIAVGLLGTEAVTDFPANWTEQTSKVLGSTGIPTFMLVFAVLAAIFVALLHFSPFGRGIYDIGLSPEAAEFSGVNVQRTKLILFVLTGTVAALAGIFFTLRFGSARGDNATGLELQVIAAVLLGGVSIFGGRGKLAGVIAGVLLIGVISSALRLEGITVNVINIIIGLLLVLSVLSPSLLAWVSSVSNQRSRRNSSTGPSPAPASPASPNSH